MRRDLEYIDFSVDTDPDGTISVFEALNGARSLLESHACLVKVRGEVSDWQKARSGHRYGILRDAYSQLALTMFVNDAARLSDEPSFGVDVIAHGRLTIYPAQGRFQLVAREIESSVSPGIAERARTALVDTLEREGLLAPERKRPIPARVRCPRANRVAPSTSISSVEALPSSRQHLR